jgi:signal recognition particle GTPase
MMDGKFHSGGFFKPVETNAENGSSGPTLWICFRAISARWRGRSIRKTPKYQMKMTEAIINSMTVKERRNPDLLNASRRRRIARGSGTEVQDVNRLLKQFRETQKLFKTMQKTGGRGLPRLFG